MQTRSSEHENRSKIKSMWDLPLNALRAFAAIYSAGGVRGAARELGIAHSSVSRHLAELEAWLGVGLTVKAAGRRGLELTPQGRALGEAALAGQRALAEAVASVREARSESSVQIGTHPSLAVRWLLPRLPGLESAHPQVEVSVIVDRSFSELDSTDLDLAIRMGEPRPANRRWRPLMGDELYPVMSPEYWRRYGRPSRPEDLVGLRLLHDRDPQATWAAWKGAHGPERLDVRKGPRFTSTDLVLQVAASGKGVALARHQLATRDVAAGVLLRPLGELSVVLEESYWIVLPPHTFPSKATEAVIGWLEREARAGQPTRDG